MATIRLLVKLRNNTFQKHQAYKCLKTRNLDDKVVAALQKLPCY